MTLLDESEHLHARVRAFARGAGSEAEFDELALNIAEFQRRHSPGFARLVESRKRPLDSVDAIPAVPTDAFRLTRVAVHDAAQDRVQFVTSGTTSSERGVHALRTTETYAELALAFGRRALLSADEPHTAVALAPPLDRPPSSSLGFMMELFMREFDGRELDGGPFVSDSRERWLLRAEGVDRVALGKAILVARKRAERLLLLTTSFALVALLDALGGARLPLPDGSVVMQTGGYKGRVRSIPPAELRREAARVFEIPEAAIVSEYGMTELSSQLYEGTLPGGSLSAPANLYLEPPWLRVVPVDPVSLEPVAAGKTGLARFVDLANVDSAIAIVTRDLVRRTGPGIELLGREPGAPPRGCSLAIEALLAGETS
ncbi:MAG TPA: acyl-protein synthetase [Polyangiaceae bacterium]|nr:acyl-protein synthetase [Polyangiaceae bacterium]